MLRLAVVVSLELPHDAVERLVPPPLSVDVFVPPPLLDVLDEAPPLALV